MNEKNHGIDPIDPGLVSKDGNHGGISKDDFPGLITKDDGRHDIKHR